jgi:CRISPR/Cas system-associated endoribonuclease Cas2
MANTLRAYGQLRRDSETFREFENAVREALPIDKDGLDAFLTVLEEARYSEHEIGESEKDQAIDALRGVQNSIEKILLTEDQAAVIKSRVSEFEQIVEPDIIVAEEQARAAAAAAAAEPTPPTPPVEEPGEPDVEEEPKAPEE